MNTTERHSILRRIGSMQQIAGFQKLMITEGKGKGNELIQVRNGSGLLFQIAVDRAFDISLCEFQGIPISWLSPTGPVAPYYYDKEGSEWNRSFEGGLLATCGLTYMGKPNLDQGVHLGQHGRISSTPGQLLRSEAYWEGNAYSLVLKGMIRESSALQEHLTLERTIQTKWGSNSIEITDRITNEGFQPVEHMMLYHFNFGYPLLSESTRIDIPDAHRRWIKGEGPIEGWERFDAPQDHINPTVMLHELNRTGDEPARIQIANRIQHNGSMKQLAVQLEFDASALPYLTQWKHSGAGRYVMGIEPCNITTEGRAFHRSAGTLPFLEPGESKVYRLKLHFELQD